jgi:ribonuclease HI
MIVLLKLKIIEKIENGYRIKISKRKESESTDIIFNPPKKELYIDEENELGRFLLENEYQLRKLLHNKRPETYKVGFKLEFSLIDKKDIEKFNDKSNIIITENSRVSVIKESAKKLIEIYTDGSFDEKSASGAYGYAEVHNGVILNEVYEKSDSKSSSHLELLAVINSLERTEKQNIRIYTDSQYVRKGITEWIFHWRANGFMTANGTRAKNVDDWIRLDKIILNKYIEWVWIKSHRENVIHNRVDEYVRKKSRGI